MNQLEDNHEYHDDTRQTRQLRQITWIGLTAIFFRFVFKFVIGFLGSIQAVFAVAFHSLSDISTDIAILFGIKFWSAPPDECHPYGHKRIETIITVVIGIALSFIAFGIGYNALIVSLFILKVSWDIIHPAVSELADRGAPKYDRDKIKAIVMNVDGVKDTPAIRTRKLDSQLYVDLHILVGGI